jgi:hypothetical protein
MQTFETADAQDARRWPVTDKVDYQNRCELEAIIVVGHRMRPQFAIVNPDDDTIRCAAPSDLPICRLL